MSPLSAVRQSVGVVGGFAGQVVLHPVRTSLRVVGVARGAVGLVTGAEPREEPPSTPTSRSEPPPPAAGPPAAQEVAPEAPGETFAHEVSPVGHDDRHSGTAAADLTDWEDGLDDGREITTDAGTTGVPPETNPETGLPHHAPGE